MSNDETFQHEILCALRRHALRLPATSEGSSCTRRAMKVGKKNFAFLGEKAGSECSLMVKLASSIEEARELAIAQPETYKVGVAGWTTLSWSEGSGPDMELLMRWVDESYRLFAPKAVLKQLAADHG